MTQRAIVTGASEGIGRAIARELAAHGYAVLAVARNEVRLRELLAELGGSAHRLLVADLATAAGIEAVAEQLGRERCGLLVNDAACGAVGPFEALPLERQLAMIHVNVAALVALSHAFLRQAQPGDALVNLSSVVASTPQPAQPVYSATKAFVSTFTESLWVQARARGVHVMAVLPGATDTEFNRRAGRERPKVRPRLLTQQPEDVARVTLEALARRRGPLVVSGWHNRLMLAAARVLPRRLVLQAARRVG